MSIVKELTKLFGDIWEYDRAREAWYTKTTEGKTFLCAFSDPNKNITVHVRTQAGLFSLGVLTKVNNKYKYIRPKSEFK